MLILLCLNCSRAESQSRTCESDPGLAFICTNALPNSPAWQSQCKDGCYLSEAAAAQELGIQITTIVNEYNEAYKLAVKAGKLNLKLNIAISDLSKDYDLLNDQYSELGSEYKSLRIEYTDLKQDSYTLGDTFWVGLGSATIGAVLTGITLLILSI